MRILVCGDRNWTDQMLLDTLLTDLHLQHHITVIIEGEARGADGMAALWAQEMEVELLRFPAQWAIYGRGAGPIRNQQMLDQGHPDLVLAFHDDLAHSKGTAHMVKIARKAGIPVKVVTH